MPNQIPEITALPTNATVIKILNALIKRYNSLGTIYNYKGSVQTYDELLAIQGQLVGDVYNVVQEDIEEQVAAGSNFAWNGDEWDNLGASLDGLVQSVNGIQPNSLGQVVVPLLKNLSTANGKLTFVKNDDTTIQVDNVKKLYPATLGEGADLNTLTESGVYFARNDAEVANYLNCPIKKSFFLEVQTTPEGDFVYQFLTQYNDLTADAGKQYIRTYYKGNWSDWSTADIGNPAFTLDKVFPVGSIYLSTNSANPSTYLGGTWEAFGQGRVLIGAGEGTDANSVKKTFTGGATGGEYEHTLTTAEMPAHNHTASTNSTGSHTHTGTAASTGAHTHTVSCTANDTYDTNGNPFVRKGSTKNVSTSSKGAHTHDVTISSAGSHSHTVTVNSTGSGNAHNIMQPYIGVYMWRRTA